MRMGRSQGARGAFGELRAAEPASSRWRIATGLRRLALVVALVAMAGTAAVPSPVSGEDPPPPSSPEPHPDYTINNSTGDLALCGTFRFGTLTVSAGRTLGLATTRNLEQVPVRSGDDPQVRCEGRTPNQSPFEPPDLRPAFNFLRIEAERIVVDGAIDATGTQSSALQPPFPGSPPQGNGGGGHHGSGGDGSLGQGGDGFPEPEDVCTPEECVPVRLGPDTQPGAPGAGSQKGTGGGSLILRATEDIVATGTISADGTDGGSNFSGTCGRDDDPDTTDLDEGVPFDGVDAPGGGGAGGGIVLASRRLDLSGPVSARGGSGGYGNAGGGGGGSGGVVKLLAPVQVLRSGSSVDVGGGPAGGACTTGAAPMPRPQGTAGAPGDRVDDTTPHAQAFAPVGVERDGMTYVPRGNVRIPIDAAASYPGSFPSGFTVYICGIQNYSETSEIPTTSSVASPCGFSLTQLASKSFSAFDVRPTDPNGFVNVPFSQPSQDGIWGIWAIAVRGSSVSAPPGEADAVFGVDGTPPTVTCPARPDFLLGEAGVEVSATVTDALSGPVESVVVAAADTSSVGVKSVQLTGRDLVGNEAAVACAYRVIYVFTGFSAPVDNPPVLNAANAGRTVPVKYRLTAADGTPVSDGASFGTISSVKVACMSLDTEGTDAMESYSGSSGLQYLGDGYWQLNWATPKSYSSSSQGPCRVFTLELLDTSKHTANFRFK